MVKRTKGAISTQGEDIHTWRLRGPRLHNHMGGGYTEGCSESDGVDQKGMKKQIGTKKRWEFEGGVGIGAGAPASSSSVASSGGCVCGGACADGCRKGDRA